MILIMEMVKFAWNLHNELTLAVKAARLAGWGDPAAAAAAAAATLL